MDKKITFALGLIIGGILFFLITFYAFFIVAFMMKFVLYASAFVCIVGGAYELYESLKKPKK